MDSEEEIQNSEMTIWSIGCEIKDDISTWMEDQKYDTTPPAPIERRKFTPIVNLMDLKGIKDEIDDDKKVKTAIWRAYDEYCANHRTKDGNTGPHCDIGCPKVVFFTDESGYVCTKS